MTTLTKPRGPVNGSGPWVHNKGRKAEKDRVLLLHSYAEMCQAFHVPRSRRLSPREIALMTNAQLYQANKDLYNGAPAGQARRLASRLGVGAALPTLRQRALRLWRRLVLRMSGVRIREDSHA